MKKRFVCYGYKMENGKIIEDTQESDIVKKIIDDYLSGKALSQISNQLNNDNVIYCDNRAEWNKRRVQRIMENIEYCGNEKYPQIIPFSLHNSVIECEKERNKREKHEISQESINLKEYIYCGQCGRKMYRVPKWDTREKWICNNGCKCKKYYDDKEIKKSLLSLFDNYNNNFNENLIEDNEEIYRKKKEIERMENGDTGFSIIKQAINKLVNIKFQLCNSQIRISSIILEKLQNIKKDCFQFDEISHLINKIFINIDGSLIVWFIDGTKMIEEIDGSSVKKNCNKN